MAAADKLNGAYWRKRAIELAEKQKREDDDLCLRFHREYERILHELDKEISIFYARYAANESVSMADARKLLRDAELEDFRMSLDEFRDKALAGGFDKELEEVYLRSRISRLQALQTQVELRMMELFGSQRDVLRDHLQERYTDTYYRTVYAVSQQADVASTFARIDPQTVEKILATPWVGSEFSSRIWADKDKLTRELMQTLSHGFVRGDSLDRMTKSSPSAWVCPRAGRQRSSTPRAPTWRLKLPNRDTGKQVSSPIGSRQHSTSRPAQCAVPWISASFRSRSVKPASIIRRCIRAAGVPPFR